MITDGGYGGTISDAALQEQDAKLIPTAIRGLQPNSGKFHLGNPVMIRLGIQLPTLWH